MHPLGMTNQEIENRLHELTRQERKITSEILGLIREGEKRKLYLARGYSSSFDWLVKEFGYSQSAAYRRIQAARLVEQIPEAKSKIENGLLNLSLVVQVQKAIAKEEKRTGSKVEPETKRELLVRIENNTMEGAQRIIKEHFPDISHGQDSIRRINALESRLSAVISDVCLQNLRRTREILSHSIPQASWGELISAALEVFLTVKDPLKKLTHPMSVTLNHRVITPALRAQILQRARGQCEFHDEKSQRRCESRYQIEVDHIKPRALGGGHETTNLRALCRAHNQFEAERILGHHPRASTAR